MCAFQGFQGENVFHWFFQLRETTAFFGSWPPSSFKASSTTSPISLWLRPLLQSSRLFLWPCCLSLIRTDGDIGHAADTWPLFTCAEQKCGDRVLGEVEKSSGEGNGTPLQYSCLENPVDGGAWKAAVHGIIEGQTRLSDFTFTFHSHALEKEMATHSSVLAWRLLGMAEPGGLPSLGSHRVGHDWSALAAE